MDGIEKRVREAIDADPDGIGKFLKDPSDNVILSLLANRNINEEHLVVLAKRRDLSGAVLEAVGARKFRPEGYRVKLALVTNPKTPRRVALSFLRDLRLRDLGFVTRNNAIPTELRQAAEGIIKEKLPMLPVGIKISLARQVSEDVLKCLFAEGTPMVVKACLENTMMNEAVALWAINHKKTPSTTIENISMHQKWSAYKSVRFALSRNPLTPIERAIEFVQGMNSFDQRYLYNDPSVPAAVKVQVEIELERKGQPLSPPNDAGRVTDVPEEE
jgi:hypothetical protein